MFRRLGRPCIHVSFSQLVLRLTDTIVIEWIMYSTCVFSKHTIWESFWVIASMRREWTISIDSLRLYILSEGSTTFFIKPSCVTCSFSSFLHDVLPIWMRLMRLKWIVHWELLSVRNQSVTNSTFCLSFQLLASPKMGFCGVYVKKSWLMASKLVLVLESQDQYDCTFQSFGHADPILSLWSSCILRLYSRRPASRWLGSLGFWSYVYS